MTAKSLKDRGCFLFLELAASGKFFCTGTVQYMFIEYIAEENSLRNFKQSYALIYPIKVIFKTETHSLTHICDLQNFICD